MGGVIGFTLREENGTEYRMSRWTNWTPWAIDNINLAHKSPEHIEAILNQWKTQMALPEDQRHWAYCDPFLAPSEYGLVVVDLMKNKILDCNHYHRFGTIFRGTLDLDLHEKTLKGFEKAISMQDTNLYSFWQFYKEKRIKDFELYNPETGPYSYGKDINSFTVKDFVDLFSIQWNIRQVDEPPNPLLYGHFILDMSPFEVVRFDESAEGWTKFRQAILDLGFVLTDEEEKIWEERIKEDQE
jgi:hypothetical protein